MSNEMEVRPRSRISPPPLPPFLRVFLEIVRPGHDPVLQFQEHIAGDIRGLCSERMDKIHWSERVLTSARALNKPNQQTHAASLESFARGGRES